MNNGINKIPNAIDPPKISHIIIIKQNTEYQNADAIHLFSSSSIL